jgi:hypothetical protein
MVRDPEVPSFLSNTEPCPDLETGPAKTFGSDELQFQLDSASDDACILVKSNPTALENLQVPVTFVDTTAIRAVFAAANELIATQEPSEFSPATISGLLDILREELELIYCKIDFNLKCRRLILDRVNFLTEVQEQLPQLGGVEGIVPQLLTLATSDPAVPAGLLFHAAVEHPS